MTEEQAEVIAERLDELARLFTLQFARQFDNQPELVLAMSEAGFETARIAELIGAKYDTVYKTIKRAQT